MLGQIFQLPSCRVVKAISRARSHYSGRIDKAEEMLMKPAGEDGGIDIWFAGDGTRLAAVWGELTGRLRTTPSPQGRRYRRTHFKCFGR